MQKLSKMSLVSPIEPSIFSNAQKRRLSWPKIFINFFDKFNHYNIPLLINEPIRKKTPNIKGKAKKRGKKSQ